MDVVEQLVASPLAAALAGLFGAIWGSFLNVCIARVPLGRSVVRPPSHCFACGRTIRPWDNVPLVSYLLLRGRCRSCGARFSPRYAAVEALTAVVSAVVFWNFVAATPDLPLAVRLSRYALYFAFAAVLIVLSFIDLDTKRLPDVITLPSIPIFFLAGFGAQAVPWTERAIGAAAGYLVIRIIADAYYYLLKREGMGLGDGKLLAVIGAVLGWKALPFVIFSGSLIGTLVAVPFLLAGRGRATRSEPERAPGSGGETQAASDAGADAGADPEDVPTSIRHVQIPFGPFLSLGALGHLIFLGPRGSGFVESAGLILRRLGGGE